MANLGNLLVTGSARFLNKIKGTVENADKLGGASPSESATGSTIVKRNSNGYIYGTYFNSNINNENINSYTNDPAIMFTSNDKWIRRTGKTNFQTWLGFNGTTFYSGNKDNSEHNANNAIKNGNYYYSSDGPATSLGASTNDGALYVQSHSDPWVGQIAQDYRNGGLYVRGKNNGTWQSWYKVWDSRNLSSKAAAASGTDLSLVTTGEKATWNAKGSGTVTQVKVGSTAYNPSSGVISLPAYPTDTNNAVTQTATDSTDANYEVLFSGTADNSNRTEGVRKSSKFIYNSSKSSLKFGLTGGLNPSLTSIGTGSLAMGSIDSGSLQATAVGSLAHGKIYWGQISAGAAGAVAYGATSVASTSNVTGVIAIRANGIGSSSHGYVVAPGSGGANEAYITAQGDGSSAFGNIASKNYHIYASGKGSHASGYCYYGNNEATGQGSFVHGQNVKATSSQAVAFNENNTASGEDSFCTGKGNTTSGFASFASGEGNTASGHSSVAFGHNTTANLACQLVGGDKKTAKFSGASMSTKGDGYVFGVQGYANVYSSDTSVTALYGLSGEISATATVSITLAPHGMYLLCVESCNASTGAFYGNTVRFVTIGGNSANSNVLNLGQSTNAPCSITAMANGVKLKNSAATYITQFNLIRVA